MDPDKTEIRSTNEEAEGSPKDKKLRELAEIFEGLLKDAVGVPVKYFRKELGNSGVPAESIDEGLERARHKAMISGLRYFPSQIHPMSAELAEEFAWMEMTIGIRRASERFLKSSTRELKALGIKEDEIVEIMWNMYKARLKQTIDAPLPKRPKKKI